MPADEAYEAHRIALGVPRGGVDFAYGDTFPHEADMDQLGGVDFDKGCYVGQEVVSRVEHRSSARSRVVPVAYDEFAPISGLPVMAGEKQVGTLGSTAKGRGLAIVRLDRVADALAAGTPLTCGNIAAASGEAGLGELPLAGRNGSVMSAAIVHPDGLQRCPWPKQDPLYVAYHDEEWGVPEYDDRALYEKLMLDGFQAGLSWITILRKRENFRARLRRFRSGKDRALHAEENRAADAGCRHRAQPRQDRGRGDFGARLAQDHGKRAGIFRPAVEARRRQADRP